MKYVRFMGPEELQKYETGQILENHTDWSRRGSTSKGFCFFSDTVPPEERIEYLTGVVDMQLCCIFEPVGPLAMTIGFGRYRDPERDTMENFVTGIIPTVTRKEYSIEWYSNKTLKLIQVGDCDRWRHEIKWRT